MFERDYRLEGKHATYAKFLKDSARLYDTIVDVYMNGAIFGLLYDRRAPRDTESKDNANILAEAFINRRSKCILLFRLVLLLEKKTARTANERIDRAFRDDADEERADYLKEDMDLFNEYVRGGIEVMYERFIEGGHSQEDYIEKAMDFMEQFKDDLSGNSFDEKIAALIR